MAIPKSGPLNEHRDFWSAAIALATAVALSFLFIRSGQLSLQGVSFKAVATALLLAVLVTYAKLAVAVGLAFFLVLSALGLSFNEVSFFAVFFGLWFPLWLSPAVAAVVVQRRLQLPAKNAA